jgi:hypothetical protein
MYQIEIFNWILLAGSVACNHHDVWMSDEKLSQIAWVIHYRRAPCRVSLSTVLSELRGRGIAFLEPEKIEVRPKT